jgi:homoserine O-succinyltransferase
VFVNNMPDSAFAATERQFLGLLEAGAGATVIEVRRYSFEATTRGPRVAAYQADEYFPMDELWDTGADLVIVTGSEPLADSLEAEPFWPESLRLLAWAEQHGSAILLSCLAAHFALHAFDGIDRRRLAAKCAGVFAQAQDSSALTAGMHPPVLVPHSRLNDVALATVESGGWDVVLSSPEVGWTALHAVRRGCDVLLLQGHPEYDPTSLLREYRRDANRYLGHERDVLPVLPAHCVGPEDLPAIEAFHRRVCSGHRDRAVMAEFDFDAAGDRAPWPWRDTATQLYRNWIQQVVARLERPAATSETR